MTKKLFFIYTNPRFMGVLYEPTLSNAFDKRDDVDVRFVLDDSLLADTAKNNQIPTPSVVRRLYALVENCAAGGADCVVVGCTAINLAVKQLQGMVSVPLVGIDHPVADKVIASGAKKVVVVSHSKINAATVARMMPGLQVDCIVPDEAAALFAAKNWSELEKLLYRTAEQADNDYDAVVFAHISTDSMRLLDGLPPRTFRIGAVAIDAISAILQLPK